MSANTQGQGALSESQRALLAQRLRRGRGAVSTGIPRRAPGAEIPLSFGQEQLWFIDQFAPGLSTYNIPVALRLRGGLDLDALHRAMDLFVARHESLRTRLVTKADGSPGQVVDEPGSVDIPVLDLSGVVSYDEREQEVQKFADEETHRPFVLAEGPLFRPKLAKVADDDYLLMVVVHHSVFDGWSTGVMLRELPALYEAELMAEPVELPELPVQYGDYAIWERQRLQGDTLEELVGYWREALSGLETVQMPTDHPRPVLASFDGAIAKLDLGPTVLADLKTLSVQRGTTVFATVLTALQVLLHRYTGQEDIIVGTASANRSRVELAPLTGFLVNTLPVRTDLSGDPTFTELLAKVWDTTVAAYSRQELPFARMVEALGVERDPSRAPVFQIGFTLDEINGDIKVADLTIQVEDVDLNVAKFDLNFSGRIVAGSLVMTCEYCTALFERSTIDRMLGHFQMLLEGIATDPSSRISELPLLTEPELYQELIGWNDTATDFDIVCFHQRFETQVQKTPEGIAAEYGDDQVTYGDLNAQANRIARRLHELGVGPEVLVGISVAPGLRRMAGLLGILKAGGGYVPLDPDLPDDRLAYMVEDAAMPVVLVDQVGEAGLPATEAAVVSLDREWDALMTLDAADPHYPVETTNVAYVIYTSGSTGKPKGVVVEHASAMNFLIGMIEHWSIGPGDRVLQFASLSFDVSVMDIFMTLMSGATAVIGSRETLLSPPRLAELIRRDVTFACMPPAVLNLLTGEEFPKLRVLLSAGDELSSELVRAWLRPGLHMYNGYGPTEASIGAAFNEMDGTKFPPPIGHPKPNYQCYVLDGHCNPVSVGVIGELHIGGAGVARGYLNQPELTAERFIPDPFRDEPGARLYKTGDLVRRRPDGLIQFIGRVDNQVKIHGLRIELGEIETALATHPAVAQAVVTVFEDQLAEKHIVGYVRLEAAAGDVVVGDLRHHLAERLPGYMVPNQIMILDAFPLSPNGKIDRKALPEPVAETAAEYVAPTTLLETMLAETFADLLKLETVGIDGSFFDIGGNSLQAMQLVARLREDLALDLDVSTVFLAPTPRQLTSVLVEQYGLEDESIEGLSEEEAAEFLGASDPT
jgi:amino acid adenylation domain-containing protein